jgi:hypothetical protein
MASSRPSGCSMVGSAPPDTSPDQHGARDAFLASIGRGAFLAMRSPHGLHHLQRTGSICTTTLARTGRNLPWHCWHEYPLRHDDHTTTISGWPAHDPWQHARQQRAVARSVLLAVPPPGDPERRPLGRSRASAIVRTAHGLHPVRHHRCRCPAELAGATGTAQRRWQCAVAMSAERR